MTPDQEDTMLRMLIDHEGMRTKPYMDTVGKLTIGIGRNLDDNGISESEAIRMCINDMRDCDASLEAQFIWYKFLTIERKYGLINMRFNLGMGRLRGFKKMLAALAASDWEAAATEALDSKWATQVGKRSEDIAKQIRG